MLQEFLYNFYGFNKQLFMYINTITNVSLFPKILKIFSQAFFIGNFALIYIATCSYFYFKIKKSGNPQENFWPIYKILVKTGIIYAFFSLSYALLKFTINLPRPFCSLPISDFVTILNTNKERCLSSFPSAHSALSILVAYFLWPYVTNTCRLLLCIIIIMVAISRITLAMHYPADILYSALIIIIIVGISNFIYQKLQKIIVSVGHTIYKLIFS